jgi:hypothetical protein
MIFADDIVLVGEDEHESGAGGVAKKTRKRWPEGKPVQNGASFCNFGGPSSFPTYTFGFRWRTGPNLPRFPVPRFTGSK